MWIQPIREATSAESGGEDGGGGFTVDRNTEKKQVLNFGLKRLREKTKTTLDKTLWKTETG